MLICRIAIEDPTKDAERAALLDAHRAYLRSGAVKVVQSGPLLDPDQSGAKLGALLIADVKTYSEFKDFSESDPYISTSVYSEVRIFVWDRKINKG